MNVYWKVKIQMLMDDNRSIDNVIIILLFWISIIIITYFDVISLIFVIEYYKTSYLIGIIIIITCTRASVNWILAAKSSLVNTSG